jgi:hypothetical protein
MKITTKMFKYLLLIFLFVTSKVSFSQVIFSENFEGALDPTTELPFGWAETGMSDDGIYMVGDEFDADAAGFWPVPAHTKFAMTNDDLCDCDKSQDRLILPLQDFSTYSGALKLFFEAVNDNVYGGTTSIEVSIDGGNNWQSIFTLTTTSNSFEWQSFEVSLTQFIGMPNVLISFLYDDQGQWATGLAIDDVSIELTSPNTQLALSLGTSLSEYSIIPQSQFSGTINLNVNLSNIGDVNENNVTVFTNVYLDPDLTNPIQSFSTNANSPIGSTNLVSITNYSPPGIGTYVIEHYIAVAGDNNTANDTVYASIEISENEYARDLGNFNGGALGNNTAGSSLILGQTFQITNSKAIEEVLTVLAPTVVGGFVKVLIGTMNGGVPNTTGYIGESANINIDQAFIDGVTTQGFQIVAVPITSTSGGGQLILNPGTYFIAVRQDGTAGNMGLYHSDGIFTPNTCFYNTNDGAYATIESAGLNVTPIIRAYLTDPLANQAPTPQDDFDFTNQDTPVTTNVNDNDTDPDGDELTFTIATNPQNGIVVVNGDGTITYTPNPGFFGTDTYTYQACDPGGLCATATVTIIVNQGLVDNDGDGFFNDVDCDDFDPSVYPGAPEICDGKDNDCNGLVDENLATTVYYIDNDGDGFGGGSAGDFCSDPGFGYTLISGDCDDNNPNINPGAFDIPDNGIDEDCDGVDATTGNQPPVANDDNVSTPQDTPVDINALANDFDPEDGIINPAFVMVITQPTNGTVTYNQFTGIFTYTPNLGFTGTDSFTYGVADSQGAFDQATVTITVTGSTNQNPIANDDFANTITNQSVAINVVANDSDPDGSLDLTSISVSTPPANGTISINFTTGVITYTPNPGFSGQDQFVYFICDNHNPPACDNATVTINVQNAEPPVANDDDGGTIFVNGENGSVNILENDTDINGDPFPWSGHTVDLDPSTPGIQHTFNATNPEVIWTYNPSFGTISCNPGQDVQGLVSITYELCDPNNLCDMATVTFNVVENVASLISVEKVEVKVFPNPTSSVLNVYSELEISKLNITNTDGRIVLITENTKQIDVSSLVSGFYFIEIEFVNAASTKVQFVKQ